ncbi:MULTISPECIES: helix-turn-helix transcriptional regulator [Acidaminococcus]|uniref:helix-turn-helix domain-containing protein n=1 Tax=Acidaminococcus fermentans TaxID=905 RepID=UPI00307ABEE6
MDAEMMETIIASIRYWRLQKGISVRTISLAVGRSPGWLTQVEQGSIKSIPDDDLLEIARVLGMKLRDLIKPIPEAIMAVSRDEAAFGLQNLEKLRKKKRLTVPQFNDRLGLSKGHLHRVLAGYNRFGIKAWWQISKALGIPLGTLIGRDNDEKET